MKLNSKEVIKENGKKIDYKLGDELLEKKYVLVDCLASNPYENLRQSYNFTLTSESHQHIPTYNNNAKKQNVQTD